MGLFEQFPYTNFHELNLNWLIEQLAGVKESNADTLAKINEMQKIMNDFMAGLPASVNQEVKDQINDLINTGYFNELFKTLGDYYQAFANKKVLIIGDSISADNPAPYGNWVSTLIANTSQLGTVIDNRSANGAFISRWQSELTAVGAEENYNIIILQGGVNDCNEQNGFDTVSANIIATNNLIASKFPNAMVYYISPLPANYGTKTRPVRLQAYRLFIQKWAVFMGWMIIDGFAAPNFNMYFPARKDQYTANSDGLHPNTAYAPILCEYIAKSVANMGSPSRMNYIVEVSKPDPVTPADVKINNLNVYFEPDRMKIFGAIQFTAAKTGNVPLVTIPGRPSVIINQACTASGGELFGISINSTTKQITAHLGSVSSTTLNINAEFFYTDNIVVANSY